MTSNSYYTYKPLVDFRAPIEPGIGLGNIRLDQPLQSLKDWLLYNFMTDNYEQVTATAFHGIYIEYSVAGKVNIVINVINSQIETIGCHPGYEGGFDGLKPGVSLYELLRLHKDAYINDGYIYLKNTPGIRIDYPEIFEDYESVHELPDFMIEGIYVFDLPIS